MFSARSLRPLGLLLPLASVATADVTFNDFSNPAGLNLVGSATIDSNQLVIAPGTFGSIGAAWFQTQQEVGNGFTSNIFFTLPPFGSREGFAFVIQNSSPTTIGDGGCELGYDGIPNSLAVEFDLRASATCSGSSTDDPASLHISVHTQGTAANSAGQDASLGSARILPNYADGNLHFAHIDYVPGTLLIYVDNFVVPSVQVQVDLEAELNLNAGEAFVGFTGASGNAPADHRILAWTLGETGPGTSNNTPPLTPVVTGPLTDGLVVSPQDPHLTLDDFVDPDGDDHECTDWEIWTLSPLQKIWEAPCSTGVQLSSIQLADGTFVGPMAGALALDPLTNYGLRARFRDDSGDSLTQWGPWGERFFETGTATQIFPLELDDVADVPPAQLTSSQGNLDVFLPGGPNPATLRIESGLGAPLTIITGDDTQNVITDFPELPAPVALRVVVQAGDSALNLPDFDLRIADDNCEVERLLLPGLNLAPFAEAYFWISSSGESYEGNAGQMVPDFSTLARGNDLPWIVNAPGFIVEDFASGFTLPVNIAFVPNPGDLPGDPFFYVTELYGTIKVVTRDGTVSNFATNLLDYAPNGAFPGAGEQGLTGIVVEPNTGDVFYSTLRQGTANENWPKVSRLTSNDGGLTAATDTTVLDLVGEAQGQSHQISTLTIHPDGKMFVHMGDGFIDGTALDLDTYRGKILRMNLDGSPADDNPMFDLSDGIGPRDYIYAYGVRNPFGGARRALDGKQYLVENGPSVDRFAQINAGQNFGYDGSNASMMTDAIYNWAPARAPVSLVFIQPETFGGSGFPTWLQDQAFVTESGPTYAFGPQALGKCIVRFQLDANGDLIDGPNSFLEYVGPGRGTAVGLAAGPDGLYMTDLYAEDGPLPTSTGSNVLRIRYVGLADCNGNGVHDLCDLANGISLDVNGNEVPDECECSGMNFCSGSPNSVGGGATLSSAGSCQVAENDFWLSAGPVPDQPGIFYYGPNQLNGGNGVPLFDGVRCVGGNTVRLPIQVASGERADLQLDLAGPFGTLITPGTTWNFQYWYRDPAAGGTGANFSDGLQITFE